MASKKKNTVKRKRAKKANHRTRHHIKPTDAGALALARARLPPPVGDFTPSENQKAALAYVAMEPHEIGSWPKIAKAIGVHRSRCHEWSCDPLFLEWWDHEVTKQQRARAHTMVGVMERIAIDDEGSRSDQLAAAKAYRSAVGETSAGVDTGLSTLLAF